MKFNKVMIMILSCLCVGSARAMELEHSPAGSPAGSRRGSLGGEGTGGQEAFKFSSHGDSSSFLGHSYEAIVSDSTTPPTRFSRLKDGFGSAKTYVRGHLDKARTGLSNAGSAVRTRFNKFINKLKKTEESETSASESTSPSKAEKLSWHKDAREKIRTKIQQGAQRIKRLFETSTEKKERLETKKAEIAAKKAEIETKIDQKEQELAEKEGKEELESLETEILGLKSEKEELEKEIIKLNKELKKLEPKKSIESDESLEKTDEMF